MITVAVKHSFPPLQVQIEDISFLSAHDEHRDRVPQRGLDHSPQDHPLHHQPVTADIIGGNNSCELIISLTHSDGHEEA